MSRFIAKSALLGTIAWAVVSLPAGRSGDD